MKKPNLHIKNLVLLLAAVLGYAVHSQAQLKIGSSSTTMNANAILELQATNKGLLLPRVALSSTTNAAPLSAFVNGMLVYDTVAVNDVTPGMYYCDGTKWIRLSASAASGNAWNITGNTGTDPAVNFIGTADNNPLVFKTNGAERIRVTRNGRVGLGTNNPNAALHVNGDVIIGTLLSGNIATDSLLVVDPSSGLIKKASLSNASVKVLKRMETVVYRGQMFFITPASFTDANKISMYRNGVMISFTPNSSSSIVSEIPCDPGDEIRIVQIL